MCVYVHGDTSSLIHCLATHPWSYCNSRLVCCFELLCNNMLNAEGEDLELKKRVEKEGRLGWDKKSAATKKKKQTK